MSQALVFVAVLLLAAKVSCFPNGAPAPACLTLSPNPANHGAQPMPLPIPFVLANFTEAFYINGSLAYEPGQTYRFTVTYAPGQPAPFRGFLLQGRQLADDTTPLGTFNIVDDTSQMGSCENQPESALTHINNLPKTTVDVEWVAPPEGSGAMRMGWALVQTAPVYWANLRSEVVQELGAPTELPPMTMAPATMPTDSATGIFTAASSLMLVISTVLATLL